MPEPSYTNLAAIQETCEATALKDIFYRYYSALVCFAAKLVKDKDAAEDIVEDVFIKLWHKQPDFSKYTNIKALLYIAVKNACINYSSRQKNDVKKQNRLAGFFKEMQEDFILNEIIRAEVLRELYEALQQLPVEQRRVMHLLYVDGMKREDIAAELNISVHTVKKHKLNAVRTLRKKLNPSSLLLLCIFC